MATRKARKVGAAKSRPAARRATSKTSPPKEITIPYVFASDYCQSAPTGSLVRAERNSIVISFYVDEIVPVSHKAKLVSVDTEGPSYQMGKLEEEPRKLIVGSVRIDPEHAASLAPLIAEKCHSIRPDLFPEVASPPESVGKKK